MRNNFGLPKAYIATIRGSLKVNFNDINIINADVKNGQASVGVFV